MKIIEIFLYIILKVLTNCIVAVAQTFKIFLFVIVTVMHVRPHCTIPTTLMKVLPFKFLYKQNHLVRPDYSHVVASNLN